MFAKIFKKKTGNVVIESGQEAQIQELKKISDLIGLHSAYLKKISGSLNYEKPSLNFCTETDEYKYESYQTYSYPFESEYVGVSIFVKDKMGELMIFHSNSFTISQQTSPYCLGLQWKQVVDNAVTKLKEEIEDYRSMENEERQLKQEKEREEREFLLTHFENKYEKELGVTDIDC